uniref:Bactericidal permeability-increasing protein n=1 Tax=Xenopus tropicalis TaxID=8364 RepID=A0A803K8V6_XENTR
MKLWVPLVLLVCGATKCEEPGIKGRLTLKGLHYGWQVVLEEVQRRLSSLQIPDVSGSVSVPVLGAIYYSVSSLQIQELDLSHSDASFSSDTGLKVSVSDGRTRVTGYIEIRTVLFGTSSSLEVSVDGLSLSAVLGLTRDDAGRGALWNAGCSSSVGQVDLNFHGGSGWILSMFKGSMLGPIHDAFSQQLCPQFDRSVVQMETLLSSLPVTEPVDSVAALELSLVSPPLITEQNVDLLVRGQFVGLSQRWDVPYSPVEMDLPDAESRMLVLAVSQFSANSASYVHYKSGALRANITDDMIPKESPLRLNTKSFAAFAPELPNRFPGSPPLLLQLSAPSPPEVTCQTDLLTLGASLDIQLSALYPESPPAPAFQLQADFETEINILLSEEALGATLKLQKVFPIPTPLVRLQSPTVRVFQGFLLVVSDLEIDPWTQYQKVSDVAWEIPKTHKPSPFL